MYIQERINRAFKIFCQEPSTENRDALLAECEDLIEVVLCETSWASELPQTKEDIKQEVARLLTEFLDRHEKFDQVRRYVKTLPKNGFWLFPGRTPEEHTAKVTLQFLFYRLRDAVGLDRKFSIHSLRHTTAMRKVRSGDSPVHIQNWLRQRSLESASRYFRLGANAEYNARVAERDNELFQ
jgi:integrase